MRFRWVLSGISHLISPVDEAAGRHFQRLCEAKQRRGSWVPEAAFDAADLGWVDAARGSKVFLRQVRFAACIANVLGKAGQVHDRDAVVNLAQQPE